MVELSGLEYKKFMSSPLIWNNRSSWDDTVLHVNGVNFTHGIDEDDIADTDKVQLEGGCIDSAEPGVPEGVEEAVEWWRARVRAAATLQHLSATVPNEHVQAVRDALSALGIVATFTPTP